VTERSDAEGQAVAVPRQDGLFAGEVAFVTGATSGIGRATALAFASESASVVVVADVAADGNRETARKIEQVGGQALAVACDVARGDQIKAAAKPPTPPPSTASSASPSRPRSTTPPRASASMRSAPASSTPR
jgi:orotate phosphoribosyltransferase